jgi:hypothetical protein
MGTQVWLDHLREPDLARRRLIHTRDSGLGDLYDAELGRALSAPPGEWPKRRKAAMIHIVAALLNIDEKTVRRRLAC